MKRDNTIGDLSAVVTGMLLAFNLPVTLNPLFAVIGTCDNLYGIALFNL